MSTVGTAIYSVYSRNTEGDDIAEPVVNAKEGDIAKPGVNVEGDEIAKPDVDAEGDDIAKPGTRRHAKAGDAVNPDRPVRKRKKRRGTTRRQAI